MELSDLRANTKLQQVGLKLTMSEARELRDGLDQLIVEGESYHFHLASADYQVELSVALLEAHEA